MSRVGAKPVQGINARLEIHKTGCDPEGAWRISLWLKTSTSWLT